ncbi:hypothetical protein PGTUg99_007803 [Puccinia graminis f. sp. tritici]|uniref:Uncharacterized protein n=1 Tax=Puccinia graminis f. sp. tritici TaxID=56615 RepID=A0A5B0RBR4_PUCGR|nr:hypothetical protein PGTUg99_007803 [Puccinia graminis f. sp. tritici]
MTLFLVYIDIIGSILGYDWKFPEDGHLSLLEQARNLVFESNPGSYLEKILKETENQEIPSHGANYHLEIEPPKTGLYQPEPLQTTALMLPPPIDPTTLNQIAALWMWNRHQQALEQQIYIRADRIAFVRPERWEPWNDDRLPTVRG